MHIKKIYKNEARPRPFRPDPRDRGPSGKWGDVDVGAADAMRYQKLQAQAKEFNDDPRLYVENEWGNRCDDMLYALRATRNSGIPRVAVRAGYASGFFNGPAKKAGERIYSIMLEFPLGDVPDYLAERFVTIMSKVATKEGLFVNNDSTYGSGKLGVALGYEGDLPITSREGDALAADLAKRTVNTVRKVYGIINAEKDRKFGKASEARCFHTLLRLL